MKVENAKMERKQDEINGKVNETKVRPGCVQFFVGFFYIVRRLRQSEVIWVEMPPLNWQSFSPEYS